MSDTPEIEARLSQSRDLRHLDPSRSRAAGPFTLPTKFVAGRKEHRCTWCGKAIAKGEQHHYWPSVGTPMAANRMHPECLGAAIAEGAFEYRAFKGKRPSRKGADTDRHGPNVHDDAAIAALRARLNQPMQEGERINIHLLWRSACEEWGNAVGGPPEYEIFAEKLTAALASQGTAPLELPRHAVHSVAGASSEASTAPPKEPRFVWTCNNGCGNCGVKRIEFEYSRTEDMGGNLLESKTEPQLVSACCGAELVMWDNERDESVAIHGGRA